MRFCLALLASVLGGCAALPDDGALMCNPSPARACPEGYSCVDGRCYRKGHGPVFDLSMATDDIGSGSDTDMGGLGDLAGVPAPPRLVVPLSVTTVARRTPTLRWVLGPGSGEVFVDLCKDRPCAQPLGISTQVAADSRSAVPMSALPPGWVFWRVRTVFGSKTATSATWQFWVGKATSGGPDVSSGCTLDVNGDGYSDFLVGASGGSGTGSKPGAVHLYLGSAGVSNAVNWNGGGAAARIDVTNPNTAANNFGIAVDCAGDVNGDGYADFVAGASGNAAYLFLGGPMPSAADWNGPAANKRVDLVNPDPTAPFSSFGRSVSGVGDVDGDGYAEFLVGNGSTGNRLGVAHLYFGGANPTANDWNGASPAKRVDVTSPDGMNSFFGDAVAGPGDVNGDGFADFLVGASGAKGGEGTAHLYLGHSSPNGTDWNSGSANRFDLSSPYGVVNQIGAFGQVVAPAGDVNADGYADFVITAQTATPSVVYVYLGGTVPNNDWNSTIPSRRIDLTAPSGAPTYYGNSASKAGDVNGDGFEDFLIGGSGNDPNSAYLYLGLFTPGQTDWNAASTPNRFAITTTGAGSGTPFAPAGDVNGDGYLDFLIGMSANSIAGGASLYLGESTPSSADWAGTSPPKRIDLTSPDGSGANFGATLALLRQIHKGTKARHLLRDLDGLRLEFGGSRAYACNSRFLAGLVMP